MQAGTGVGVMTRSSTYSANRQCRWDKVVEIKVQRDLLDRKGCGQWIVNFSISDTGGVEFSGDSAEVGCEGLISPS